jgi:hypothetical protein
VVTGEESAVREVLRRYRDHYRARDLARLDAAMRLFVPGDEPEMVGTEAVVRGDPDWAVGREAVRALTAWDWSYWPDVELDLDAARIIVCGEVAWATLPGTLTQSETGRAGARRFARETILPRLRDTLDDETRTVEERLAETSVVASLRVRELVMPDGHRRALTFTAVLVRRSSAWLLHTTHWALAAE